MANETGVKNRRLLITKNSIMMLVMLVIIFLAIFAWYYIQRNVSANGINIKASEPGDVEIAITENGLDTHIPGNYNANDEFVAGTWKDTATFRGPFAFSSDVTSDGLEFIIPAFSSTEDNPVAKDDARTNGKIVNINGVPKVGSAVKTNLSTLAEGETADYVKIPFYLRSKSPNIGVRAETYLAMAAEKVAGAQITGASSVRRSTYGDFTSDALVASMRVSLTGGPVTISGTTAAEPTSYESTFVWVPRPDLFLKIPAGTSEDDWSLITGITKTTQASNSLDPTTYKSGFTRLGVAVDPGTTFKHSYYTPRYDSGNNIIGVSQVTNDTADNSNIAYKSDVSNTKTLVNGSVPTLGAVKNITGFTNSAIVQGDGYYYYKYYLNLWIEGTDTEARRAMDTGKFDLHIEFGSVG